jgi:hypothetical protein
MKAIIRVPMRESFAYIEFEAEGCGPAEAVKIYRDTVMLSKVGEKDDNF